MVRMVQTRWIEQAKGMIMTRRSIGPDDAFAVLVEHSQASNEGSGPVHALVGLLAGPNGDIEVSQEAIAAAKVLWDDVSTRNDQAKSAHTPSERRLRAGAALTVGSGWSAELSRAICDFVGASDGGEPSGR